MAALQHTVVADIAAAAAEGLHGAAADLDAEAGVTWLHIWP